MLTPTALARTVAAALEEDAPWGDITSTTLLPADASATADLVAREAGVFSGGEVFAAAFTLTDPAVTVCTFRSWLSASSTNSSSSVARRCSRSVCHATTPWIWPERTASSMARYCGRALPE